VEAGITPADIDIGRLGSSCGSIPIEEAEFKEGCVLGSSQKKLGSLREMQEKPILNAIDSIIEAAKPGGVCERTIIILDYK